MVYLVYSVVSGDVKAAMAHIRWDAALCFVSLLLPVCTPQAVVLRVLVLAENVAAQNAAVWLHPCCSRVMPWCISA